MLSHLWDTGNLSHRYYLTNRDEELRSTRVISPSMARVDEKREESHSDWLGQTGRLTA